MSKTFDPLSFLRKSPIGQRIVNEIEAGDAAAKSRSDAAVTVAEIELKLADAERTFRTAAANEKKTVAAARQRFNDEVAQARQETTAARNRVYSLNAERDRATSHLRDSSDPRIDTFKEEMQARFQSSRGRLPNIVREVPTGQRDKNTGIAIEHVETNGAALTRWAESIFRAIREAEALKLDAIDGEEVEARLATLRAEVDEAEASVSELTLMGEKPADAMAIALANAKPTVILPSKRYQAIEEPELVG
jgi:multidrug efflux pump subunit AcrB